MNGDCERERVPYNPDIISRISEDVSLKNLRLPIGYVYTYTCILVKTPLSVIWHVYNMRNGRGRIYQPAHEEVCYKCFIAW